MSPAPHQPRLTVLSGPSGVGKGTVVNLLRQRHPELWLSVSATTRLPRPGEENGIHYFFHSQESFQQLIDQSGLLEWASFAGNSYGTPREPVEERLKSGVPVLLEIELEGARQVRQSFPEAFQVFLRPPSLQELEDRLRARGTDSEEAIQKRLARAKVELEAEPEFDAVVINDDLEQALEQLIGLMFFC